jgi:hypothetical protein
MRLYKQACDSGNLYEKPANWRVFRYVQYVDAVIMLPVFVHLPGQKGLKIARPGYLCLIL